MIKVLVEKDIRQCVGVNKAAFEAVAEGFSKLAEGKVNVPPIVRIDVPEFNGEVDIKTAYIEGIDSFAIKIAAGFLDNYKLGLPTGSGMMVLVSAKTGIPESILLDNGYLTDVRTGIAGAIAAEYLARKDIKTAGVIGSGAQARFQMRGLKLVRNFKRLFVFGLISEQVDGYISEMTSEFGIEVIKASSVEQVVRQSDVVVTTTPSRKPYLKAEWLHPGLHITCMGADSEYKQELYADVFARTQKIVCDRKLQALKLGELHHALDEGIITNESDIIELGELTLNKKAGRQTDEEITICDLTGVGVQDTAIALLAFQQAKIKGLGLDLNV